VRELASRVLQRFGYTVLVAADGTEAVEIFESHEPPIDLLITDIVMPDMNGKELYETLAVRQPGLRVLYMSGYTDNVIVHHGVLEAGVNFIQKPFSVNTLAERVREVLDK
jgi:DNA-binding response OmpR family regulator